MRTVTYVGPMEPVELDGHTLRQGDTVTVPDALADGLVASGDFTEAATTPDESEED